MEVSVLLMQQIAQLFIVLLMGYVVVGCGAFECPVCTQHIALHHHDAYHDRSV